MHLFRQFGIDREGNSRYFCSTLPYPPPPPPPFSKFFLLLLFSLRNVSYVNSQTKLWFWMYWLFNGSQYIVYIIISEAEVVFLEVPYIQIRYYGTLPGHPIYVRRLCICTVILVASEPSHFCIISTHHPSYTVKIAVTKSGARGEGEEEEEKSWWRNWMMLTKKKPAFTHYMICLFTTASFSSSSFSIQ